MPRWGSKIKGGDKGGRGRRKGRSRATRPPIGKAAKHTSAGSRERLQPAGTAAYTKKKKERKKRQRRRKRLCRSSSRAAAPQNAKQRGGPGSRKAAKKKKDADGRPTNAHAAAGNHTHTHRTSSHRPPVAGNVQPRPGQTSGEWTMRSAAPQTAKVDRAADGRGERQQPADNEGYGGGPRQAGGGGTRARQSGERRGG